MSDNKVLNEHRKMVKDLICQRKDIEMIYKTYRYGNLIFKNSAGKVGNLRLWDYWEGRLFRFTDTGFDAAVFNSNRNFRIGDLSKSLKGDQGKFEFTCTSEEIVPVLEYVMDNYFEIKGLPTQFEITDSTREILTFHRGEPIQGYLWAGGKEDYFKERRMT